jgi:hypothetical protein
MLDPIIDWIKSLWRGFIALFKLRLPKPEEGGPEKFRKTRTAGRVFWRGGLLIFIILFLIWNITFFWNVLWTRGDTLTYPQEVLRANAMVPPKRPRPWMARQAMRAPATVRRSSICRFICST